MTTLITRANVYVDGFNLCRGLLKGNPACKWLDLRVLATRMFPAYTIGRVHYFTANVTSPPHDPGMSQRQQTYIRALRAQPDLHIHFGRFNPKIVKGSLLDSQGNPTWVRASSERIRAAVGCPRRIDNRAVLQKGKRLGMRERQRPDSTENIIRVPARCCSSAR